jgi:tetratricopeptide (TPR) repeat protein
MRTSERSTRFILLVGILFGFLNQSFAQNCSPEALERDQKSTESGDFKGQVLLGKLETLMREMQTLANSKYESGQKRAIRHCLVVKDQLFQKLMVRNDAGIQDNANFQETVADFYKFHKDHASALERADIALKISPKSLPLLIKTFQFYADSQNVQLKELKGKPIAEPEKQRVLLEISRRADLIVNHPEASKELMVDALTHQAWIAKTLKNFPQEMTYWEKVLTIDPKNQFALQNRFAYFSSKGLVKETIETMKRLFKENLATNDNWIKFLDLLFNSEQWQELISWKSKVPKTLLDAHPAIQCAIARAHLELGQKDEAQKIMQNIPALKGKAALLAEQNHSRLRELEADALKSEGRLSEALDEYKKALPASPRPLSLKEKISLLIYEYRKGLNFKPIEATKKDLQEVVTLLEKSVYQTELKSSLFAIYLHSLQFTGKSLNEACERYKSIYPELLHSKDYLNYCSAQKSGK